MTAPRFYGIIKLTLGHQVCSTEVAFRDTTAL
jgi:hypothetical protein